VNDSVDGSGLEALRRSVADIRDKVESMAVRTYRGTDATGLVAVEVSGTGKVRSVEVSAEAVRDLTTEALGTACLEAIRTARARLGREAAELVATTEFAAEAPEPGPRPDPSVISARLRRAAEGLL
jgi:DNA-binding protein YbaB